MKHIFLVLMFCVSACSVGKADRTTLADAAERQDWPQVSELLDKTANRESANDGDQRHQPDGMTAMHWAARWNHPIAISRLAEAGCEISAPSDYGATPLSLACRFGHLNAAVALLDLGADPNEKTSGDETMLMHAARSGNASLTKALLDHGAEIDAKQRGDQTALMWAAAAGHADVVDLLIARGADWSESLRSGFTPLHFAVRQGNTAVANRLLDAGADVNDRMNPQRAAGRAPRKGMSPLMLAVESGHFELALQLIERGADPNDQRSGYAPLHALSWVRRPPRGDNPDGDPPPTGSGELGSLQFARELVEHGADVNLQLERGKYNKAKLNPKGATPLLFAAFTSDLPYAKALVELGADVNLANEDNTTPMLAAAGVGVFVADEYPGSEEQALAMINQLAQWGAKVDDVDDHGETVIHGAAYRSFPRLVERLVELGADPKRWHQSNELGSTPKQVAEGKRPGSFKPNQATIAAIDRALKEAGIDAEDWSPGKPKPKKWEKP